MFESARKWLRTFRMAYVLQMYSVMTTIRSSIVCGLCTVVWCECLCVLVCMLLWPTVHRLNVICCHNSSNIIIIDSIWISVRCVNTSSQSQCNGLYRYKSKLILFGWHKKNELKILTELTYSPHTFVRICDHNKNWKEISTKESIISDSCHFFSGVVCFLSLWPKWNRSRVHSRICKLFDFMI